MRGEESRSCWGDRSSPRLRRPVLEYLGLFGPLSRPLNSPRKIFVTLRPISHSVSFPCYHSAENSPSMFTPTLGVAATIAVSGLLTHPLCSYLELNGRITPSASPGGLAKMSWPGQLAFHTLSNGKSVLVDDAHNRGSAQGLLPSPPTNGSSNLTHTRAIPLSTQTTVRHARSTLLPSP